MNTSRIVYICFIQLRHIANAGEVHMDSVTTYTSPIPEQTTVRSQPTCPFCGGYLVRLPHFCRCAKCSFEFCDECGGADQND
jgi:hypothetical protein